MVEVVIALAVVLAVSATALTITLYSVSMKMAELSRAEAINFAENVWNCFKASESEEEFLSLVDFTEGANHGEEGHTCILQPSENDAGTYTYSPGPYRYTVNVRVQYGEGRPTFWVDALDMEGNTVVSFDYTASGRESGT